jgi:tetratricopeptide (TPR) repeat protein
MEATPEELLDEGNSALALGDLEDAVRCYRAAIETDPVCAEGWHAYGMVLMKMGRFQEAIEAGLKLVELTPNDQLAWSSLSMFYVKNHLIAEAEAAGAKARILSWGGKVRKEPPPEDAAPVTPS